MSGRRQRKSGFDSDAKPPGLLAPAPSGLGQHCPQHCPAPGPMGIPLSIREAASLIGCSPWTVRQTLMPRGLPYFRSGGGKLIFYTNQIIGWIQNQQKGTL